MLSKLSIPIFKYDSLVTNHTQKAESNLLSSDIEEVVRSVENKSKWNDPGLIGDLRQLVQLCQKLRVPLRDGLNLARHGDDNLLSEIMHIGSHEVLSVLHHFLQKGTYHKGKIEKTEDALLRYGKINGCSWGFLRCGKNRVYVGDLKEGLRHGKGKLYIASDWYYEGDFFNNQKHGFGVETMEGPRGRTKVGIFIDDIYRGNPHSPVISRPKSWAKENFKRLF